MIQEGRKQEAISQLPLESPYPIQQSIGEKLGMAENKPAQQGESTVPPIVGRCSLREQQDVQGQHARIDKIHFEPKY